MSGHDDIRDRMEGCLWGHAIGDALGLGTEFMSRLQVKITYPKGLRYYSRIIRDAHRRRWPQGAWTDDTDLMLCVLNSYSEGKFQPWLLTKHLKAWMDHKPPGIGRDTFNILYFTGYVDNPVYSDSKMLKLNQTPSAANGAIMRTSALGLKKDITPEEIAEICLLTHSDPRCVGSCVIISSIINRLIWQNESLSLAEVLALADAYDSRIAEWVNLSHDGELDDLELDNPEGMGYTLRTMSAALWSFWHAVDWTSGLLNIVNAGGDADTNAAVSAAVLGAKFGRKRIPLHYIHGLHKKEWLDMKVNNAIRMFLEESL